MRLRYPARNLCRAERAEGGRKGGREGDPRCRAALRPGLRAAPRAAPAAGAGCAGAAREEEGGSGPAGAAPGEGTAGGCHRGPARPGAAPPLTAGGGAVRGAARLRRAPVGTRRGKKRFDSVKIALVGTGHKLSLGPGLGGGGAAGSRCSGPSRCGCPAPPRPPALGEFKGARGESGHVGGAVQTWRGRGAAPGGLLPPAVRRSARGVRRGKIERRGGR